MDRPSTTTYSTIEIPRHKMAEHNGFHIFTIVAAVVSYVAMVIINGLSNLSLPGMFTGGSVGNISDKYYTDVTPAGYAFIIWGFIYAWQSIMLIYSVASIFRKGSQGRLYRSPILLPPVYFIVYFINNILNIGWIFAWDRSANNVSLLIAAFVILAFIAFTLYVTLVISMVYLNRGLGILEKAKLKREKWWIYMAVQNALAIYATWTTIATLLNLAAMLEYKVGVDHTDSGTISLAILSVELVAWFFVDILVLDKHTRYLFMPHVVVCWAVGAVVAAHWGVDWISSYRNAIFTAIILAVAVAAGVIKFIVMFYRHFKVPNVIPSTLEANPSV